MLFLIVLDNGDALYPQKPEEPTREYNIVGKKSLLKKLSL